MTRLSHLLLLACTASTWMRGETPVNNAAAVSQKFMQSIAEYVKVRKAAIQDLPALKPHASAADVAASEAAAAQHIQAARAGARQGDICTPEVSAELKRLIGLTMKGQQGIAIRKSLRNAELSAATAPLTINGRFPDKLPVVSTPPTLLMNLPRLPPEVEYRAVGRALVLRDSNANVIIDFVPEALPVSR